MTRSFVYCLLVVALSAKASLAADDALRVLLVRPVNAGHAVTAALLRVRGELVAEGFDVTIQETEPAISSASAMAATGRDAASASIGLFLSPDGKSVELSVVDEATAKTVMQRLNTGAQTSEQLSEVLAVRAVELLHASLLESRVGQRGAAEAPTTQTSTTDERRAAPWAAPPLVQEPPQHLALHLGGMMLWNPTQLEPAWLLVVRAEWLLHPHLHPRLSLVGLGTRAQVSAEEGEADVRQAHASLELALLPWTKWSIKPQLILGAGVWHIIVDGRADWPYEGRRYGQSAFALDAGLGASIPLTAVIAIACEGHATLAMPRPVVRFANRDVAQIGSPAAAATIALKVSL